MGFSGRSGSGGNSTEIAYHPGRETKTARPSTLEVDAHEKPRLLVKSTD